MTSIAELLSRNCDEMDLRPVRGVYVLLSFGEVVYVGQSRDVQRRIRIHYMNRSNARSGMVFDRAFVLPIPKERLCVYEGALIRAFNPRWNGNAPFDSSRDAEILKKLGIDPDGDGTFDARMYAKRSKRMRRGRARRRARIEAAA